MNGVPEFEQYLLADEAELAARLADAKGAEPPRNLPSDGSKGQWRAAKKHRVRTLEWLLHGADEGVYGRRNSGHGDDTEYELAVHGGVMYRAGDYVSVACGDEWAVLEIDYFTDDGECLRAVSEAADAAPALEVVRPELDSWMDTILRAGQGRPFKGAEGDFSDDVHWYDRPYLTGDIVRAETEEYGVVRGRIVNSKFYGRMDEPTYRICTDVMDEPPTYDSGFSGGRPRDIYKVPESSLEHVNPDQCAEA